MTADDIKAEQEYLYQERLGILCGAEKPTPEQERIAREEAEAWRFLAEWPEV